MALNFSIVKRHPVATGAVIIVGGLILFMLMRGGAGGGVAVSSGPSDAQIAAGMQAQQMQFAAMQQSSSQQFQLAAGNQQIQGQLALAQLQLVAAQDQIGAGLTATAAQIELAKYQTMVAYQAQQDANATSLAGQQAVLKSTYDLAKLSTDALVQQSLLQAQTHMFDTAAFTDVQKLYYQGQTQVSITQSNNQVKIEGIQADAQKYIAKKQGQSSMFGSLLGFAGTALSFFSDPRLKSHIEPKGTLSDGTPLYNYKYLGLGKTRSGPMAPEVESRNPMAVSKRAGFGVVDFGVMQRSASALQHRQIGNEKIVALQRQLTRFAA